jgi:hypothetical protein
VIYFWSFVIHCKLDWTQTHAKKWRTILFYRYVGSRQQFTFCVCMWTDFYTRHRNWDASFGRSILQSKAQSVSHKTLPSNWSSSCVNGNLTKSNGNEFESLKLLWYCSHVSPISYCPKLIELYAYEFAWIIIWASRSEQLGGLVAFMLRFVIGVCKWCQGLEWTNCM